MTKQIVLQCLVSTADEPVLQAACKQLLAALTSVGAVTSAVDYSICKSPESITPSGASALVIMSMTSEVDTIDTAWPDVESRLRKNHASLTMGDNRVAYLCTVFRHVPGDDRVRRRKLRTRIRQLNLLAAELSRETGLYVIDIDRAFADIGAQALATDYQLSGSFAVATAGRVIADTLLSTGFDAFETFEIQEAARVIIASEQLARAAPNSARVIDGATNIASVRAGRRTQNAQIIGHKSDRMGAFMRQVLTGRIALRDAAATVSDVIARRGIWHVFRAVGRQAGRAVRTRKAAL